VWIAGPNGRSEVVRIDPVSGKVITTVDRDTVPGDLAVGLGSVWVLEDGMTRIDEVTGRIIERLDIGDAGGNVVVAGGSGGVTAGGQPHRLRVFPKRSGTF